MAKREKILRYAESMTKKSKAFRNFVRGISSDATKSEYSQYVKNFMEFHNLDKDFDKVVKLPMVEIDDLIVTYLDKMLERGVKGITQRCHLMGIERLFLMNDCLWHKDRIRRSIKKDDEIIGGNVPITTQEIQIMLSCTKSIRTKALVHFLASTGMRPAGLTDPILRMKHLIPMYESNDLKKKLYVYAIKIYDESKSGYWAFLTPEATKTLERYFNFRRTNGENLMSESPVFTVIKKSALNQHLTDHNARFVIGNLLIQSGIKRTKISKTRYDKAMMYMFRKRFNTILKLNNELNSNIAEKLMAHKKGLDGTYLQPTREECFAEFVKAIPELTVNPAERQKLKIIEQETKISEYQKQSKVIDELKQENEILKQTQQQQISDIQVRLTEDFDEKLKLLELKIQRRDTSTRVIKKELQKV